MRRRNTSLSGRTIKAAAWSVVAGGVVAPVLRRKQKLPALVASAWSFAAPVGLAVALPRSKKRDILIYALQMWAYLGAYETPTDMSRVHVEYPIRCDQVLGLGRLPTERLQPSVDQQRLRRIDYVLAWSHWLWYLFPHSAVIYMLVRKHDHFARTATMVAATFDLGAVIYRLVPTAPPWWAAKSGKITPIRRIMIEVGEKTWGNAWPTMFDSLNGNPVAAMPSLHFGISVVTARMLAESGPIAGAYGWTYTLTLGYALVYLGEHYLIDLIVGFALAESVRLYGPSAAPALERLAAAIQALEKKART